MMRVIICALILTVVLSSDLETNVASPINGMVKEMHKVDLNQEEMHQNPEVVRELDIIDEAKEAFVEEIEAIRNAHEEQEQEGMVRELGINDENKEARVKQMAAKPEAHDAKKGMDRELGINDENKEAHVKQMAAKPETHEAKEDMDRELGINDENKEAHVKQMAAKPTAHEAKANMNNEGKEKEIIRNLNQVIHKASDKAKKLRNHKAEKKKST